MKPELWHYGPTDRTEIESILAQSLRASFQLVWTNMVHPLPQHILNECKSKLDLWHNRFSMEIVRVFGHWHEYEDKREAERYLEYLKFLFILAGGEPCGW